MRALRLIRLARRQRRRRRLGQPARRRIILHIGAHKTGTTYIQHTLEANRARLPLAFEVVPRRLRELHELTLMATRAQNAEKARAFEAALHQNAMQLAARFDQVENLLITHEGLPGPLPGRAGLQGIYPYAHILLPPVIAGLSKTGAEVTVVFYKRAYTDWKASLYRYRFRDTPARRYRPKNFSGRTGLPENWQEPVQRLRHCLPPDSLNVISYEDDRASGLLGRELYRIWGLPETEINDLRRLPPRNVSRDETRHDHQF
jgi:hypothetical protein